MTNFPDTINAVEQLDDILSLPSSALIEFMKHLDGDIMILGAGGKIGPTMARKIKRAIDAAGVSKRLLAVDIMPLEDLKKAGIETCQCDLLDIAAVQQLPRIKNIIYMVGRKFGSTGSEHLTWAINVMIPYHVAQTFTEARIAVFSTGCVYPLSHVYTGGAIESTAVNPIGEYSMSCLGRERMFDYFSHEHGEKVVQIRLNYAVELRYGVLYDVAQHVWQEEVIDLTTGFANVIWQGDACEQVIRAIELAASPAAILNVTGPEMISIRQAAQRFGKLMDKEARFTGEENGYSYLNNAAQANKLFGNPQVPADLIMQWIAHWIMQGGANLGKPTHFEVQDGKY